MKITRLALAAAPLLLWAGAAEAQDAPAGIAPPPAGKGQVVFYRPAGEVGPGSCTVREGAGADVRIAKLGGNRYFVHPADPGIHQYWARSIKADQIRLEIEAGETYFVKCTMALAMFGPAKPNLSPSSQAEFAGVSAEIKPVDEK